MNGHIVMKITFTVSIKINGVNRNIQDQTALGRRVTVAIIISHYPPTLSTLYTNLFSWRSSLTIWKECNGCILAHIVKISLFVIYYTNLHKHQHRHVIVLMLIR